MCCPPPAADRLPPRVAAMLAGYRALHAERPQDWGGESDGYRRAQPYARWLGTRLLAAVFSGGAGDWPGTVRSCLDDPLPAGLTVASLGPGGVGLRSGPVPYVPDGGAAELAVLLDSTLDAAGAARLLPAALRPALRVVPGIRFVHLTRRAGGSG